MAKRSVTINLVNNTPYYLVHYWEAVCDGSWGPVNGTPSPGPAAPNASLPAVIPPNSTTSWSSADTDPSLFKGTEAWAKYSILCQPPLAGANLLYIYWNNPYVWTSNAQSDYLDHCVAESEGNFNSPYANLPNGAPCQQQPSPWPSGSTGSTTPSGLTGTYGVTAEQSISSVAVACQLAQVSGEGSGGPQNIDWGSGAAAVWNWTFGWPVILEAGIAAAGTDVNLVYTFVLRQSGSVGQSVGQIYDKKKGLRALAVQNKQPSLRQLFSF
jgi:hypothetical protein